MPVAEPECEPLACLVIRERFLAAVRRDDRVGQGQVGIPAKLRKNYKLKSGDQLLVIAGEHGPIGFIPMADFSAFLAEHEKLLSQIRKNVPA